MKAIYSNKTITIPCLNINSYKITYGISPSYASRYKNMADKVKHPDCHIHMKQNIGNYPTSPERSIP